MPESPFLIVGLGNPGTKYSQTRHNVGFLVVETLVRRWGGKPAGKFQAELYSYPERRTILLKPQTFMNLSGRSVSEAVQFYKVIPSERVMVISDDLDLLPGQLRIRKSGGAGGHNGLKSIIELLGTEEFPRLRIGIGRSPTGGDSHILGKVPPAEMAILEPIIARSADAMESWISVGIEKTMNEFNRKKDEP